MKPLRNGRKLNKTLNVKKGAAQSRTHTVKNIAATGGKQHGIDQYGFNKRIPAAYNTTRADTAWADGFGSDPHFQAQNIPYGESRTLGTPQCIGQYYRPDPVFRDWQR